MSELQELIVTIKRFPTYLPSGLHTDEIVEAVKALKSDYTEMAKDIEALTATRSRLLKQMDYGIALQRAIEYHCRGKEVPEWIAKDCSHHAKMLNDTLESDGEDDE